MRLWHIWQLRGMEARGDEDGAGEGHISLTVDGEPNGEGSILIEDENTYTSSTLTGHVSRGGAKPCRSCGGRRRKVLGLTPILS
jgi:hypothetical protein